MTITIALTGVCAQGNPPPPPPKPAKPKRQPTVKPLVSDDVPMLIWNPVVGLRGSEIPNNSPPSMVRV